MKAIQYTSFGDSTVLHLQQVDKPAFKDDEVLIRLEATTVNPFDIKVRSGSMQRIVPVQLPYTPGSDVVGVVEAAGSKVARVKVGDVVFGTTFGGTYAEYIAIKEVNITQKPFNVSAQEAVALAVPIVTAYTLLVETAQLQAGQKVLIQGAAGGVGGVTLQMAKALGAFVIGTGSGAGVSEIKGLGADEAIDYKTQDFTQLVKNVDLVADLAGGETQRKSFEVLKKGGKLISIVMPPSEELAKKFDVTAQFINSAPSFKKLDFGKQLVEQGKITPRVSQVLKLEEAARAQDLVSGGGVNGKIVLAIS